MTEFDARRYLAPEEMALVPYPSVFTLVGHGGWHTILDESAPLMVDGFGLDLPDGRALVRCQIPDCACGRIRIWANAEDAASTHGSWVARPSPAGTRERPERCALGVVTPGD